MNASLAWGSIGFGMVIGWITYYTMRKNTKERTLADLTVIITALIGPAVMAVFPAPVAETKQTMFGYYGIGLAIGFFLYYVIFVLFLWKAPKKLLDSMFATQVAKEDGTVVKVRDTGNMMGEGEARPRE
jgi:Ca2+/H+ antiporter